MRNCGFYCTAAFFFNAFLYYLVTLNQSTSIHPRLALPTGSLATIPILAPIHLPSRMVNSSPTCSYFLPSLLKKNCILPAFTTILIYTDSWMAG